MSEDHIAPPLPDPLANMPAVSPDLGNNMWKGVGQGIDNFMNSLIERVGELAGAAITKGPGLLLDVAAKVSDTATRAVQAPFNTSFSPSASLGAKSDPVRAPEVPTKQREIAVSASESSLGNLSPPSTPSQGISQGQGRGI